MADYVAVREAVKKAAGKLGLLREVVRYRSAPSSVLPERFQIESHWKVQQRRLYPSPAPLERFQVRTSIIRHSVVLVMRCDDLITLQPLGADGLLTQIHAPVSAARELEEWWCIVLTKVTSQYHKEPTKR